MTDPTREKQLIQDILLRRYPELWMSTPDLSPLRGVMIEGYNGDVDIATTPETIWPNGGSYPWQTSSFTAFVESTSGADAAGSTGATQVRITGLDTNYELQTELLAMNGTAGVATVRTDWLRILLIETTLSGSGNENAGNITLKVTNTGGAVQAYMFGGSGLSNACVYTTPLGCTSFVVSNTMQLSGAAATTEVRANIYTRKIDEPWISLPGTSLGTAGVAHMTRDFKVLPYLPEKTDLDVRAFAASTDNTQVIYTLEILEIPNALLGAISTDGVS